MPSRAFHCITCIWNHDIRQSEEGFGTQYLVFAAFYELHFPLEALLTHLPISQMSVGKSLWAEGSSYVCLGREIGFQTEEDVLSNSSLCDIDPSGLDTVLTAGSPCP